MPLRHFTICKVFKGRFAIKFREGGRKKFQGEQNLLQGGVKCPPAPPKTLYFSFSYVQLLVQVSTIVGTSKLFSCLTNKQLLVLSSLRKPKRLKILGDDSRDYMFLVKGGEDIRVDQRVEQVSSNHQSTLQGVVCQNSFGTSIFLLHTLHLSLSLSLSPFFLSFPPLIPLSLGLLSLFFFPHFFLFSYTLSSLPCSVVVCGNEWHTVRELKLFSAWTETKDIQCNSHDTKVMMHAHIDYFWYTNAVVDTGVYASLV